MTLREELRSMVENLPDGVGSVSLEVEWLRRRLDEPADFDATEGEDRGASRWLSTSKAARRLSVQPETVARWCRDGRFPNAWKTSDDDRTGEWRIPVDDLRRLEDGRSRKPDRVRFSRE